MRYKVGNHKEMCNLVELAAACFIMHLTTLASCFLFRNGGRIGLIGVEVKLYGSLASCMLYDNGWLCNLSPAFSQVQRHQGKVMRQK